MPVDQDSSIDLAGVLAELYGLDREDMILQQGAVFEVIQQVCEEIRPSIVVIGSIAHTGPVCQTI